MVGEQKFNNDHNSIVVDKMDGMDGLCVFYWRGKETMVF